MRSRTGCSGDFFTPTPSAEKTAAGRVQAGHNKIPRTGTFRSTSPTKVTETTERSVGVLFGKRSARVLTRADQREQCERCLQEAAFGEVIEPTK
jgi:hypothetical protein